MPRGDMHQNCSPVSIDQPDPPGFASMTTLADDLLRSRTIPELRELVNSLERDSGAKRTELQQMVGSKYHDFIQSADKISLMKEKSVSLDHQIGEFWTANEKLLSQAKTILNFSQPQDQRLKPQQAHSTIEDNTCAKVWDDLNDCDVFRATLAVVVAKLLTGDPNSPEYPAKVINGHYDTQSRETVQSYAAGLPSKTVRELSSISFLQDTVVDDIHMLLLCADADGDGESHREVGTATGLEVVQKAKALAALSLMQTPLAADAPTASDDGSAQAAAGVRRLLQTYLSSAGVLVQDILDSQLNVTDAGAEHEQYNLHAGIVALVKLLQRIIVDVHLLFLSSVDLATLFPPSSEGHTKALLAKAATLSAGGVPLLGLVGVYQRALLQETTERLQQYVQGGEESKPVQAVTLVFDSARAYQDLVVGGGDGASVGVGHAALLREQRKTFKHWLEGTLEAVTARCKAVLSSLTSAAEVAQLQQQVWAACTHIVDTAPTTAVATAPSAAGLDEQLAVHFAYTQQNWAAASAAVLGPSAGMHLSTGADAAHSGTAQAYLWTNVFRACFLHQVERLLKCSCDEVLAHTKLHVLRVLRQQGVAIDTQTLKIIHDSQAPDESATATTNAGKKRPFELADFSGDASQLSSPAIYQMAEKIRQQFEQDLSRLLADVIDPVSSTEAANSNQSQHGGNGASGSNGQDGDAGDPQSAGALARAMRTQCAQLVGHLLVLLRNLLEACQGALRERGSLPVASAAEGDLFNCLRDQSQGCILTPDLHDAIRRFSGCNLASAAAQLPDFAAMGGANSTSAPARTLERADHHLLTGTLLLGRLAWLFKLRGGFLEYALQPRTQSTMADAAESGSLPGSSVGLPSGAGAGTAGASFAVRVRNGRHAALANEDQFRSAFEIADTNGDGVVTYHEALEALGAITGEGGDLLSPAKSGSSPKQSAQGVAFSLTSALTPTLTYSEFALICGSTLLNPEDCQPVARLGRCLEQLIASAHITWALCVVQVLGGSLREQYGRELGFRTSGDQHGNNAGSAASAAGKKATSGRAGTGDRDKHKPFKLNWVSRWIDLDGNVEEDGASPHTTAQKEHVLIPGGMSHALRVFLHKVTQHGSSSVVSMDTMQRCAVTPVSARRDYEVVGEGGSTKRQGGSRSGMSGKSGKAAPRDEFSDLLDEVQEVSDNEDEDAEGESAFFEGRGLLATLAGCDGESPRVVLSHLVTRVLALVSLAYIHHVTMSLLRAARPSATDALEDAATQVVFDLSVLQTVATQWGLPDWQSNASSRSAKAAKSGVVGLTAAVADWQAHLDPINAELVLPLVSAAVTSHAQCLALLMPHRREAPISDAASGAATPGSAGAGVGGGSKTTEQLLAHVFPSTTHTAARFTLLPVAIAPAPAPVPVSSRPSSTGHIASASGPGGASRHSASSGNLLTGDGGNGGASTAAAQASATKPKTGVMNWWG